MAKSLNDEVYPQNYGPISQEMLDNGTFQLDVCFGNRNVTVTMVRSYYDEFLIDVFLNSRGIALVVPQWHSEYQGTIIQGVVQHGIFLGKAGMWHDIRNASSAFTRTEILDYGKFHSFLVESSKRFIEEL